MLLPRPASGELTPALLCVALACGLVAQIAWPKTTEFEPGASATAKRPPTPIATPVPEYTTLLSRPLFSPDRRSLGVEGAGEAVADNQRPILIGLARDRRVGSAVVRASDGAVQVVRPGETWRGWRLVAIGAKGATFSGPGGRFTAFVGEISSSASPPPEGATVQEVRP